MTSFWGRRSDSVRARSESSWSVNAPTSTVLTAPFVVSRLLIPPGQSYEDRKRSLAPFDRVVDPQEKMRDDVARLAEACEKLGKVLLVIVNNKAEGSSPLTVRALAERIARPRPT